MVSQKRCQSGDTYRSVLDHWIARQFADYQLKTCFTPDQSGPWELGLGVAGQADLYVNGEKVVDNSTDQKAGLLFVSPHTHSLSPLPKRSIGADRSSPPGPKSGRLNMILWLEGPTTSKSGSRTSSR